MDIHSTSPTAISVNGERTETRFRTLAELVAERGFGAGQVATAVNGEFVPRSARAATLLRDGDKVEIVAPRQGG